MQIAPNLRDVAVGVTVGDVVVVLGVVVVTDVSEEDRVSSQDPDTQVLKAQSASEAQFAPKFPQTACSMEFTA